MKPLAIDLYCGLGGWTEGLLAEGYEVIGFDVERHIYGDHRYPAQLVLQDVRTLDGAQFKDAALIVASSPCQEFSYRAMPWKKAKALPPPHFGMELFAQAERIQREAIAAAAGHFIPCVQENVRGAQKWVGRARWHYGSYYLWGDVPALMPIVLKAVKVATMGAGWYHPSDPRHVPGLGFNTHAERGTKNSGGSWFNVAHNTTSGKGQNPVGPRGGQARHDPRYPHLDPNAIWEREDGTKQGGDWVSDPASNSRRSSSKSNARKAASARIAKIPFALAAHIARTYLPR